MISMPFFIGASLQLRSIDAAYDTRPRYRAATRLAGRRSVPPPAGGSLAAAAASAAARGYFREFELQLRRTIAPINQGLPRRQQGSVLVLAKPVLPERDVEQPDQSALGLVQVKSVGAQPLHGGQHDVHIGCAEIVVVVARFPGALQHDCQLRRVAL